MSLPNIHELRSSADIDKLSPKQLKELIREAGLSHSDCIEKHELQAKAQEAGGLLQHRQTAEGMTIKTLRAMLNESGAGTVGCTDKNDLIKGLDTVSNSKTPLAQRLGSWSEQDLRALISKHNLSHLGLRDKAQLVPRAVFAKLLEVTLEGTVRTGGPVEETIEQQLKARRLRAQQMMQASQKAAMMESVNRQRGHLYECEMARLQAAGWNLDAAATFATAQLSKGSASGMAQQEMIRIKQKAAQDWHARQKRQTQSQARRGMAAKPPAPGTKADLQARLNEALAAKAAAEKLLAAREAATTKAGGQQPQGQAPTQPPPLPRVVASAAPGSSSASTTATGSRNINVTVPDGVQPGQKIRFNLPKFWESSPTKYFHFKVPESARARDQFVVTLLPDQIFTELPASEGAPVTDSGRKLQDDSTEQPKKRQKCVSIDLTADDPESASTVAPAAATVGAAPSVASVAPSTTPAQAEPPTEEAATAAKEALDAATSALAEEQRARRQAETRMLQMEQERDARRAADGCTAIASMLAFRQYVAMLLRNAGKVANKDVWRLRLRAPQVVEDMLGQFSELPGGAQLWRKTFVTFLDEWGNPEPGIDEGGLTANAHATFWRSVLKEDVQLFECCEGTPASYLPRADADEKRLELVGRVLLKSMLDNHPVGAGLCSFVFEFLCDSHDSRIFVRDQPQAALTALADFDPSLSKQWAELLDADAEVLAVLTRDLFDDQQFTDEVLTPDNVAETIIAGCRRRLFLDRGGSLEALRKGFTYKNIDLTLQLAAMPSEISLMLVRGKVAISREELVMQVDWNSASCSQSVSAYLKQFIETELDEQGRLRLLRWCTGLNALPADGLTQPVTLLALGEAETGAPDAWLPRSHTCSHEIELPAYSSYTALREKLERAMQEMDAGGGFVIA